MLCQCSHVVQTTGRLQASCHGQRYTVFASQCLSLNLVLAVVIRFMLEIVRVDMLFKGASHVVKPENYESTH